MRGDVSEHLGFYDRYRYPRSLIESVVSEGSSLCHHGALQTQALDSFSDFRLFDPLQRTRGREFEYEDEDEFEYDYRNERSARKRFSQIEASTSRFSIPRCEPASP